MYRRDISASVSVGESCRLAQVAAGPSGDSAKPAPRSWRRTPPTTSHRNSRTSGVATMAGIRPITAGPNGLVILTEAGRPRLPEGLPARGLRQLRDPQAPQRDGVARQAPTRAAALGPDQRQLAEHGGDLLRDHHPPGDPPRHVP